MSGESVMVGARTPAPVADWVKISDLHRDPFPIYDRLRAEGGVHWVPAVGRYLVTSYEAVHATELDQETYSANEQGSLQIRAMGHSMLRRDDPEHYQERAAWQPVLRPGAVKRTWTAVFERNAHRYLDELIAKGPGADLVWDFAAPYAGENLREVLGFHNVTHHDLQRWSQTMIDATGNYADDPVVWAEGEASFDEVDIALDEMMRWHVQHPDESLISQLVRMPADLLPIEKIRANIKMTIGGGLNEPRDALGVAAWALLEHPQQRALVEADPGLWPAVFDESLRWIAPIGLYSRQTTREVELTGVTLPAGARLGICILSANRDEKVWPDPASFDITRKAMPHLAFGKGVHVCLGAWVARAMVASVGLPLLFDRLRGLDLVPGEAAEVNGWVFRGMTRLPVRWDEAASGAAPVPVTTPTEAAPSIAIVGAGPSGLYTAQALRKAFAAAPMAVFDALPVPYGLIRYGVAHDHQGTKAVASQFARLFQRDGVRYVGNTRVGTDVSLDELRSCFDVVVVATGLHDDAPLGVPGHDLPGVYGAGHLTRLVNGHPDETGPVPNLGEQVVVIGHGNVAMDIVRLLAASPDAAFASDLDDAVHATLADAVHIVHVVGRSQPAQAKFDPVMVRELTELGGVSHVVHGVDPASDAEDVRVQAVAALAGRDQPTARVRVEWWFGWAPVRINGHQHATAVELGRTTTSETVSLRADSVVTAVGFRAAAGEQLVDVGAAAATGRIAPGLYAAGWARRGPRGTIPDQRTDARSLADVISADVASGRVTVSRAGLDRLPDSALTAATDYAGWLTIDAHEIAAARPGRHRSKVRDRAELLRLARSAAPTNAPDEQRVPGGGVTAEGPLVILFGTESGSGELIAGDMATRLAGRFEVTVRDLADTTPDSLDRTVPHIVICSTYGDGELPTSVRPVHAALQRTRPDLSGLRYAVFGMGDRSYTETYSRGSEIIDATFSELGATRVGEYGRHDAGGLTDATETALEWLDEVIENLSRQPTLS